MLGFGSPVIKLAGLPIEGLTFGCWLHGDLVAEVTSACRGDGSSPDQILLPVVEVSDSVEQQLWIGFILAGQLGEKHKGRTLYRTKFSILSLLKLINQSGFTFLL